MLQMAFGVIHDSGSPGILENALRLVFGTLDTVIYNLVDFCYQVILNVADSQIISSDIMTKIFGRVQIILGVIMIFRLAISLLQTVINPDLLTDNKNGFSKIIVRIVIMLVLLVSLMPLKGMPSSQIDSDTSYNAYIKESGILFGTLYSLQHRVLQDNVLGKLILGTVPTDFSSDEEDQEERVEGIKKDNAEKKKMNNISMFFVKSFIKPNLKEGLEGTTEDYEDNDNRICSESASIDDGEGLFSIAVNSMFFPIGNLKKIWDGIVSLWNGTDKVGFYYDLYNSKGVTITQIINNSRVACSDGYAFTYFPLFSTVCGAFLLFFLVGISINVAIRAIKLAVLRIISPIAIISYINPKSSESGAFSSWVKMVTSTYIDLFLRLAIMFFVVLIAEQIATGNLSLPIGIGNGFIGIVSTILIIVGLFYFAKNAPKFIKQALGIKDDGGSFFGFGKMAAIGGALFGGIGSAATNYRTSREEGQSRVASALSAGVGGMAGSALGLKAALSADKDEAKAAREAVQKRNQLRASHSTLPGRIGDRFVDTFTGRSIAEKEQKELDLNNKAFDAFKNYKSTLEEEALKKRDIYGDATIADEDGNMNRLNYNVLSAALERAKSSGQTTFEVADETGKIRTYTTDKWDTTRLTELKENQAGDYAVEVLAGRADNGTITNTYLQAKRAADDANIQFDGGHKNTKLGMKASKDKATALETEMKHIKRRANYQANKNK